MKRLLLLTLLLAVIQALVGAAISVGIFRHVNMQFSVLINLLFIPPFQAAVLMFVRRDPSAQPMRAALGSLRRWHIAAFVVLDLALALVILETAPQWMRAATALHALAAAIAATAFLSRVERGRRWIVALTIVGLLAYAATGLRDWLASLPMLTAQRIIFVQWAMTYLPLFVLALVLLLATGASLGRRATAAAGWIDLAVAALCIAASILAANYVFHPRLEPPWTVVHRVLSWLSVTSVLAAALALPRGPERSHAAHA